MDKSESIKELSTALNKAQAEMSGAKKGAVNPFFKSKYADMGAVVDAVRVPFCDNGLSYSQFPIFRDGFVGVETCVCHSSGQFIEQRYSMAIPENKRNSQAQNIGSAISYARRYAISAALGIAQTDTDASEKATYTVDDSAMGWIDAVKADPTVLNQITDAGYRAFIKEQAGV